MDIKEMQAIREEMEFRLCSTIAATVNEFQRRTGLQIEGVSIEMFDVSTIAGPRESRVGTVSLNVRL